MPQMSWAYSVMVWSLENFPEQVVFLMTLVHSLRFCREKEMLSNHRHKRAHASRNFRVFPDEVLALTLGSLMEEEKMTIIAPIPRKATQ